MKRNHKNLLTFALATLFVGAGIGAVATVENAAKSNAITAAAAEEAFVNDVTDVITVSKVTMSASNRSRYDVVINFGDTVFNSGLFYTNQYPAQLGITIGDYILINGKSVTEICAPYSTGTQAEQLEARKEWLDDLDDGENANYSNEDWGFNKGWVPIVGQINTNNITLMIDRRLVAPTDLELTVKGGLEVDYTDSEGAAVMTVSEDVTFKLVPDASNVENLKGVLASTEEVETEANAVALVKVADNDKNVQYQLHTDILVSSKYSTNGVWTADHHMYLNDYFTLNGKTFSQWNKETYLAEYTTGAINSTAYQYSVPLLNLLHAKSAISNGSGTVFQFYISKAWMAAMNIDESSMVLGIREGLTYINHEDEVATTTNALAYANAFTATVNVDGESKEVKFSVLNKAEKLAEIAAMLPEDTAEYTYAWKEELPAELETKDGYVFEIVKTPIEYTVSFTHPRTGMILAAPIKYTVENMSEVVFPEVPADLAMDGYTVAWNKTEADLAVGGLDVNPVYTAIEYEVTFTDSETGESVADSVPYTVENMGEIVFPEVPEKEGYTGAWNKTETDLALGGLNVNPVYTAIEYTITFAGCEGVENITFTVETKDSIELPAVPEKEGYTAAWDKTMADIALEDTTVTAVYTEIPDEPDTPDVPDTPDEPESSAPESSAPESSAPESSAPESSVPESSEPEAPATSGSNTEEPESGCGAGCGSTVDLVSVTAALGVIGAAFIARKKKED